MKKLLIVCDDKARKYGDFLCQLISLEDDKNGAIRGTKDGEVVATVWSEKEYSDNSVKISSDQYIVFIGNSKLAREKRSHMINHFDEHGMIYSWLGKQASLNVHRVINNIDEYN